MQDLLVGQILWSTWSSLVPVVLLHAVLLTVWFKWHKQIGQKGFYVIFAFTVTASVQFVGVYLVFASLILPALATRRMSGNRRLIAGYLTGAASFLVGIIASSLFDLPTGAVIVWAMAAVALVAGALINPGAGTS